MSVASIQSSLTAPLVCAVNKGSVYEGGLRVPMIAKLPGASHRTPSATYQATLPIGSQTLCDAANLKQPKGLDGESLWSELTNGPASTTKRNETDAVCLSRVWRTGRCTYR